MGIIYTRKEEGFQVHQYGAYILHTSDKEIWNYVNQFAEFNRYTNSSVANYKGEIYNLPFNIPKYWIKREYNFWWLKIAKLELEGRNNLSLGEVILATLLENLEQYNDVPIKKLLVVLGVDEIILNYNKREL